MYVKKLLCASLLSLCTVNMAFAQEGESDITHNVVGYEESAYGETQGYIATKSATGSKMDLNITEIPQSIKIITKDMMEDRAVDTIQNVTAYDASVTQVYGENSDIRTNYGRLRGIDHIYKSSFLDGLKLLYGGGAIPNIDPYSLERVEILKGPSSVLYGASGPGGLINMQSKKPNGKEENEIGLAYGSFDNGTIFGDFNHKINENLLLRVTGKYKEGDNELKNSSNQSYFFNPSLTYLIDDDTSLEFYASMAKQQIKGLGISFNGATSNLNYHNSVAQNAAGLKTYLNNYPGTSPTAAFIRATMSAIPDATYIAGLQSSAAQINAMNLSNDLLIGLPDEEIFEKNQKSFTTVFNKNINDDTKLRSAVRYMNMDNKTHYSLASFTQLVTNLIAGTDLTKVPLEFIENDGKLNTLTLDNTLEHDWQIGKNIDNKSIVGFDFQYVNNKETKKQAVQYNFDLNDPNAQINITRSNTLTSNTDNTTHQFGLYASNSMNISEKFIVSTSLRYDKSKTSSKNLLTNSTQEINDNDLTSRVGFVYLMDNGLAPYMTYSTSFQTNTGVDKNSNAFKPTTGKQVEVGIKYQPKSFNALFTLAAFDLKQEDVLRSDPSNRSFNIQKGDNSVQGIEFNIIANPIENSNVTFSLAKMTGEQTNTGDVNLDDKDLGELPDFTASIWADYTFPNTAIGDFKIGAGIKYIGESTYYRQDYFNITGGQPVTAYNVPDYTIVDTAISTDYKNWKVGLNLYNIFDEQSALAVNSIQEGVTQGRTFKLTASYKF